MFHRCHSPHIVRMFCYHQFVNVLRYCHVAMLSQSYLKSYIIVVSESLSSVNCIVGVSVVGVIIRLPLTTSFTLHAIYR